MEDENSSGSEDGSGLDLSSAPRTKSAGPDPQTPMEEVDDFMEDDEDLSAAESKKSSERPLASAIASLDAKTVGIRLLQLIK